MLLEFTVGVGAEIVGATVGAGTGAVVGIALATASDSGVKDSLDTLKVLESPLEISTWLSGRICTMVTAAPALRVIEPTVLPSITRGTCVSLASVPGVEAWRQFAAINMRRRIAFIEAVGRLGGRNGFQLRFLLIA